MDLAEAHRVLSAVLDSFREMSFDDLRALIGSPQHLCRTAPSGTEYQIEVEAFWDSGPGATLRVLGSIDDGRFWTFVLPATDDFLIAPDGSFVGEGD